MRRNPAGDLQMMTRCKHCQCCDLIKPEPEDPDRGWVCRRHPPQIVKVLNADMETGFMSVSRFPWVNPAADFCFDGIRKNDHA